MLMVAMPHSSWLLVNTAVAVTPPPPIHYMVWQRICGLFNLLLKSETKLSFLSEVRRLDQPRFFCAVKCTTSNGTFIKEKQFIGNKYWYLSFFCFVNHHVTLMFSYSAIQGLSHCILCFKQSGPLKARGSFSIYRGKKHSTHVSGEYRM